MSKEAMKLALEMVQNKMYAHAEMYLTEALAKQEQGEHCPHPCGDIKCAVICKRYSEQEQGEPVAWMFQHEETGRIMFVEAQQLEWGFEKGNPRLKKIGPLYTTPQQRKPLTDEQIADIVIEMNGNESTALFWKNLTRAIEAAHGIKE